MMGKLKTNFKDQNIEEQKQQKKSIPKSISQYQKQKKIQ